MFFYIVLNVTFSRRRDRRRLPKIKSMNIHQISVHHDERQDRLLLRLNTQDRQEFRFWLTRRMTQRFMPAIEQSVARLEAAQPGVAATDTISQQILSELKRDAFLQKADFATPFDTQASARPLGEEPMLITDAHLTIQPSGALAISFEDKSAPQQVKSCQLHLQVSLVHGMVHLMRQAAEKAQWGLTGTTTTIANKPMGGEKEVLRYTH